MNIHKHWTTKTYKSYKFKLLVSFCSYTIFGGRNISTKHKHKHKDIRTRRRAYLTQFSIPALLKPMIKKVMADEASALLLLICSYEVWVKVTYDWSTALCLCLQLCRPRFV